MRPARLAALALLTGGMCLCTHASAQPKPTSAPASASANFAPVRFLVVAAQESILSASVAGRIAKVPVGLGDSVRMAQKQAYAGCDKIRFDGAQLRRDIGWRAVKRHP